MRRMGIGLVAAALAFVPASRAAADSLPGNDYTIDLFQGPILAPLRVTGIAGAYAGYAEGISGFVSNAASPAVREPFSLRNVDVDVSASLSIPISLFQNNDFDNSGDIDYDYSNFVYLTGGFQLQAGPVGAGALAELQNYTVTGLDGRKTNVLVGKYHALSAVSLLHGQLAVGGGVRAVTMALFTPDVTFNIAGIAPQMGFLVRPNWLPFRVGATFRFPVNGAALGNPGTVGPDNVRRAGGFSLPKQITLPWELEVGFAFQAGPRPLNPAWIDPVADEEPVVERVESHRRGRALSALREERSLPPEERAAYRVRAELVERQLRRHEDAWLAHEKRYLRDQRLGRFEAWPRQRILVTGALLVSGAVSEGVSIERFLAQNVPGQDRGKVIGTSGASVNFSPRVGLEAEPVENLVLTRVGSYYEPNRFGRVGRQHFTFGGDLRLFSTTFWGLVPKVTYSLSTAIDLAPRYESVSASIGVWH